MTWPLNGSEAGGALVFDTDLAAFFFFANQVVLMLTSLHLHEKSREVCINTRSPLASLLYGGQSTEQTTVKWPSTVV